MKETKVKPHWSFWVVCVVALIWNVMGCINFSMQMNTEMIANFPEAAQSLISTRPFWSTFAFAVAVFMGLFGDLLLLFKKSIAIYFFILSLTGIILTNIHTVQVSSDTGILVGSLMSLIVGIFVIVYSKFATRKSWIS